MALMYAAGDLSPMPDAAIFADTGWEPKSVIAWLDWLEPLLPFPVHRVMHKEGLKKAIESTGRLAAVPFFTSSGGMGKRQCTTEYKILPIQKKARQLLGYAPRKRIPADAVTMLIGISLDEAVRMKPSRVSWIKNSYPLVENRFTRLHCLRWMQEHGYPAPKKSSCLGCPYHSDAQWLEIRNSPEWEDTVRIDYLIRDRTNMKDQQFMHKSCKPLDQVRFEDTSNQIDAFGNECEGMCGL
jgi:hypothetical protein